MCSPSLVRNKVAQRQRVWEKNVSNYSYFQLAFIEGTPVVSQVTVKARKKPKQNRAQATVDAILGAMAHILIGGGSGKTSTNHIAKIAGVSIGSLYQYFPNKESIVLALIDSYSKKILNQITLHIEQSEGRPMKVAVRDYIRAMLSIPAKNPKLHQAFVGEIIRIGHHHIRELEDKLVQIVYELLLEHRNAILPKDLRLAAFILVTTAEGVINMALLKNPEIVSSPEFESELVAVILRYLTGSDEIVEDS